MNMKKLPAALLCVCLLFAALSPAACAAEAPALDDFVDRYGPLLGDGLDTLTDWLKGKTADLAPELRETLRDVDTEDLFSDLPVEGYDYVIGSVHYVLKDGQYLSVDESRESFLEHVQRFFGGDFYA